MRELIVTIGKTDDGRALATLEGDVTEFAKFDAVYGAAAGGSIVVDAAGVAHINSYGVREWIRFLRFLAEQNVEVELRRCSVPLVRQMTMLPATRFNARLGSLQLPYFCDACDDGKDVLVTLPVATVPETAPCPTCGAAMSFDDAVAAYTPLLSGNRTI